MDEISRHERFMQLFLPAQHGLYGYLRTLIPHYSDAEDVFQSAAAVMWEKFDDFQPGTRFDYWAYHICHLQVLRYLKDRKRSRLVLSDDVVAMLADRAVAVSNSTRDVMDSLEICVDKLSERDRDLLKMRFEPGATNRSIASATGRSDMAISRALNQIYGSLLECIQGRAVSEKQEGCQ
jgi:RNA polymerase sigma-70 factor, ECF subfamily